MLFDCAAGDDADLAQIDCVVDFRPGKLLVTKFGRGAAHRIVGREPRELTTGTAPRKREKSCGSQTSQSIFAIPETPEFHRKFLNANNLPCAQLTSISIAQLRSALVVDTAGWISTIASIGADSNIRLKKGASS